MRQENNGRSVPDECKALSSVPPTPRMPPARATFMAVSGLTGAGAHLPLRARLRLDRSPCAYPRHRVYLPWSEYPNQISSRGRYNIRKRYLTLRKKKI